MATKPLSGIYEIVNLENGKRYIGSAQNYLLRWKHHRFLLLKGRHHSRHMQAAWKKYGGDRFQFNILIFCQPNLLLFYEQLVIDAYKPEYNTLPIAGSPRGMRHSTETKAKISLSRIGNKYTLGYRHRPETLAKMAKAKLGNTFTKGKPRNRVAVEKSAAAHRGMRRSTETRLRISLAAKGKKRGPRSEEWCRNISAAQKGRVPSPESIEKMRATKKGSRLSADHKAKISVASKAMWARRKTALLSESSNGPSLFAPDRESG